MQLLDLPNAKTSAQGLLFSLIVLAAFFVALTQTASAAEQCAPPSPSAFSDRIVEKRWKKSGHEITEFAEGGSYRVTRCVASGQIQESMAVAPIQLPDGTTQLAPTFKHVRGGPHIFLTYGDPTDSKWVSDFRDARPWKDALPPGAAIPPTSPTPTAFQLRARGYRVPSSRMMRTAAKAGCSDSTFSGISFNFSWWARGYKWAAKISSMPAGDATRRQIGYGRHAWNNTVNSCGYRDQANFTASYAGATSAGANLAPDGVNVTDFGDVANVGCGGAVACTIGFAGVGGQMVETDLRFNSSLSWSHSGAPGKYDVWSVGAHESGHGLGLNDIAGGTNKFLTMYHAVGTGEVRKRDLAKGDVLGMRAIYP